MSFYKEGCDFCNPTDRILTENLRAIVILSNPRKVSGQFLVLPKRHVEEPWGLMESEQLDIFKLVFHLQRRIAEVLNMGSDLKQNQHPFRPEGRLRVQHLHYHVYPRTLYDNLYQQVDRHETPLYTDLTLEEIDYFSKLI